MSEDGDLWVEMFLKLQLHSLVKGMTNLDIARKYWKVKVCIIPSNCTEHYMVGLSQPSCTKVYRARGEYHTKNRQHICCDSSLGPTQIL